MSFDALEIPEKGTPSAEKDVTLRYAKEDLDKVCSEVQKKHLTTPVENLHAVSHFNTKTFSALNYRQDFGTIVKELGIRSGLDTGKVELSRV